VQAAIAHVDDLAAQLTGRNAAMFGQGEARVTDHVLLQRAHGINELLCVCFVNKFLQNLDRHLGPIGHGPDRGGSPAGVEPQHRIDLRNLGLKAANASLGLARSPESRGAYSVAR
jgi:hypothetical protein